MKNSVSLTLFLLFFVTYAYFYPGGGQNEASRLDTIRALIEDQTFIVDKYAYNSADLIQINGHYYGSKAPGSTFLGVPFYWVSSKIFALTSFAPAIQGHLACYWTGVFSVALPCAIGMVVLYWLMLRMRSTPREAVLCTLTIGLASIFFPFATLFFSHAVTAILLLIGFYQIFSCRGETWRAALGGFCLGSAIMFEYPGAAGAGLIGLYAIWKHRRAPKAIGLVVLGGLIGLLPALIQNWLAFGNPLFVSYEAYAQSNDTFFAAHKKGLLGVKIPLFNLDDWKLFLNNLAEITYRPLRGLFVFNPVLLLIFPGFVLILRRLLKRQHPYPAEMILAFSMLLAYLAINAGFGDSIVYWGGGASFGPRHLISALPFAAIAIAESLRQRHLRTAFVPLLCLSIFFCLMATAIEPRTPYQPNNALMDYYLPYYLGSQFAITPLGIFSNQFLTANSVAFNWGKLAGLPGPYQLWPLFVFWIFAAREFDTLLGSERRRGFTYATGIFILLAAGIPFIASR